MYYNYNDCGYDLVSLLLLLGPSAVIAADSCDSGMDFHYKVYNILFGVLDTYKIELIVFVLASRQSLK